MAAAKIQIVSVRAHATFPDGTVVNFACDAPLQSALDALFRVWYLGEKHADIQPFASKTAPALKLATNGWKCPDCSRVLPFCACEPLRHRRAMLSLVNKRKFDEDMTYACIVAGTARETDIRRACAVVGIYASACDAAMARLAHEGRVWRGQNGVVRLKPEEASA